MDIHSLFPSLPPELRNLIYTHTICEDNPATTLGLPFQHKIYDSSHTKVVLTLVHHGNPSLLALRQTNCLEAEEYHKFLLAQALTLRISVLFKGNLNTFIQEHWDKKTRTHLKKLGKKYAWFGKVMQYDVQILWESRAWVAFGRKVRKPGAVAKRMVEVLCEGMDADLKRKRGVVEARLHLADCVVKEYVHGNQALGMKEFVQLRNELDGVKRGICEVRLVPAGLSLSQRGEGRGGELPFHLKGVTKFKKEKDLLVENDGIVEWGSQTKGHVVIHKGLGVDEMKVHLGTLSGLDGNFLGQRGSIYWALTEECTQAAKL